MARSPTGSAASRSLIAALVLFCAATLICTAAQSIAALIAARTLQGAGSSGIIVLARAVVRDLYEGPRAGRELSLMGMIMGIVPMVAPLIGGATQIAYGWRAGFVLIFAVGFAAIVMVWRLLPETAPKIGIAPVALADLLAAFRRVGADAGFRAHTALVTTSYAGLFAYISGSSFVHAGAVRAQPVRLRRGVRGVELRLRRRHVPGEPGRDPRRARPHHRARRRGARRRRRDDDRRGGAGAAFGRRRRGADGALSRGPRPRHAAGARRRAAALSGSRRRGLVAGRLRPADDRRGGRRARRLRARRERLAVRAGDRRDGLPDAGAVDHDARGATRERKRSSAARNSLSISQVSMPLPDCGTGGRPPAIALWTGAGGAAARATTRPPWRRRRTVPAIRPAGPRAACPGAPPS